MTYALNILLNQDKTKVLMQLKDRSIYAGKFNFPGGKINTTQETIEDGALRELREETGVTKEQVQDFKWLGTMMIPHDCMPGKENQPCTLAFYALKIDERIPKQQPNETEPLCWKPVEELPTMQELGILAGDGELEYFLKAAVRNL